MVRSCGFGTVVAVVLLLATCIGTARAGHLLWSSKGGGWRAMFADIGYANLFRQAGLFGANETKFDAVASASGAAWFSLQLFYSSIFYDRAVLTETPEALADFVFDWMQSYQSMSTEVGSSSQKKCGRLEMMGTFMNEACEQVLDSNNSWAVFTTEMLQATGAAMGDPSLYSRIVGPDNRIAPLAGTDLLVQTALMPNARYIDDDTGVGTNVFFGYEDDDDDDGDPNLFTCSLSATFVVEHAKAEFWFGAEDLTAELQTYTAPAPPDYDPADWEAFHLKKPAADGTLTIKGSVIGVDNSSHTGTIRDPFGGPSSTNIAQLSASSSATGGYPSPGGPSIYAQFLTTALTGLMEDRASGWIKLLLGIVSGLAAGLLTRFLFLRCCGKEYPRDIPATDQEKQGIPEKDQEKHDIPETDLENQDIPATNQEKQNIPATDQENQDTPETDQENQDIPEKDQEKQDIPETDQKGCCKCCPPPQTCIPISSCLVVGILVFTFYSFGSILIPMVTGMVSDSFFEDDAFDGLSIYSQWPNSCGPNDGQFGDGLLSDGPTMAVNIGHWIRTNGVDPDTPLKIILTNTNELSNWDGAYNMGQICKYFDTDFNQGSSPGGFLWNPALGYPYRDTQIFADYLDADILNSSVVPIPGSNMTTAIISTTTVDNPAFSVLAGQPVEILLLNLNAIMTTLVIGVTTIEENTQPMADMTTHVAFNEVLLDRVRSFTADGDN